MFYGSSENKENIVSSIKTENKSCPNCNSSDYNVIATGPDYEYETCSNIFNIVQCETCKLAYINPVVALNNFDTIYPKNYKPFHFNKRETSFIFKVRDFLESKKVKMYLDLLPEKASILDVGCGDGRFLNLLKNYGSEEWKLNGVEFSEEASTRAEQRGIKVTNSMYEHCELEKNSFDLLIMNQVIEHFVDPSKMIEKAKSELKMGGLLNIETPSLDGWDAKIFKKSYWGGYHFPRHITLFNRETLIDFFKRRGFEVVSTKYMLSPVFWVFSMHHLLKKKAPMLSKFFSDKNPIALAFAVIIDIIQIKIFKRSSNIQIVVRKVNE